VRRHATAAASPAASASALCQCTGHDVQEPAGTTTTRETGARRATALPVIRERERLDALVPGTDLDVSRLRLAIDLDETVTSRVRRASVGSRQAPENALP